MGNEDDQSIIQVTPSDMEKAVKRVVEIAGLYGEGIDNLSNKVRNQIDTAFEAVDSSPQSAWQNYLDAIWSVLADTQDKVNSSAENLVNYSKDLLGVDLDNAEGLEAAKHPEGA